MFPPGASSNHDREAWMAAQLDTENQLQNKVDVAKETGENRIKAARATGQSRVDTQASKNEGGPRHPSGEDQGLAVRKRRQEGDCPDHCRSEGGAGRQQGSPGAYRDRAQAIATKRMTAGELSADDKALEAQLTQSVSRPTSALPAAGSAASSSASCSPAASGARCKTL